MTDEIDILEDYEDLVDEADDDFDDSQDIKEGQVDSYVGTFPEQKQSNDLYNWFWKVVKLRKPFHLVKVGNLDKQEIGMFPISVRDAMNLWVLGHTFHHKTFGNYFAKSAKITAATSMAKKGWFMDLSISQKRVRERNKSSQSNEESWRIFKKKNKA